MKTARIKSIVRSPVRFRFFLITVALASLAFPPQAGAICEQGCDLINGNTFLGQGALSSTTTGSFNTATGYAALFRNTEGNNNTASGYNALTNNTAGSHNTAIGSATLLSNTTANNNTAIGDAALALNTTGYRNTAIGRQALEQNVTGYGNSAIGFQALFQNIGSNNIGLGYNAGNNLTTGSGNVCIGSNVLGVAAESNTTRIRNIYSSLASARPVYINSDNKIGTLVSSRRFKDEIKPMDKASEAILSLKPVTFHYKKEIEPGGALMFGLVAEEVEKIDPDLVTRNDKGEAETVRYEAVNAMLLNEFLKEHRTVQEQGRRIEERGRTIAQHETEIRALASQLQKVSGEVESLKSAPRVATQSVNDQSGSNHNFTSTNGSESGGDAFSSGTLRYWFSDLDSEK
jgi:trimeric autotransporter adhesin